MPVSAAAYTLVVFLAVSVIVKVIDAQICPYFAKCYSDYSRAYRSAGQDKDKMCKAEHDRVTCLEATVKICGGNLDEQADIERRRLKQYGCSGSGAPVLSFVAMVFGVVISRSF